MVLDPVPSEMREFTRIGDIEVRSNCDNISSVLNQICTMHRYGTIPKDLSSWWTRKCYDR